MEKVSRVLFFVYVAFKTSSTILMCFIFIHLIRSRTRRTFRHSFNWIVFNMQSIKNICKRSVNQHKIQSHRFDAFNFKIISVYSFVGAHLCICIYAKSEQREIDDVTENFSIHFRLNSDWGVLLKLLFFIFVFSSEYFKLNLEFSVWFLNYPTYNLPRIVDFMWSLSVCDGGSAIISIISVCTFSRYFESI